MAELGVLFANAGKGLLFILIYSFILLLITAITVSVVYRVRISLFKALIFTLIQVIVTAAVVFLFGFFFGLLNFILG